MEENEVLVKVEGLSKKFCKDLKTSLWYGVQDLFSNIRGNKQERLLRNKEFWAVKDINFELRRGECLGLIGHNGAGKSTLLKILNGLINPDAGKVTIKGRVGALIELGAGFNPILSGRENIYNNGAILGFTKKEIDAKVEDIIDFAEIREFIDMPVQNYSSGMKVRLGFAVASQMDPDVLIIDEVLAVGDIGFRIKCLNKISAMMSNCVTIFVSHNMPQIARTANRLILMNRGELTIDTKDISIGVEKYYDFFSSSSEGENVFGNGKIDLIDFKINGLTTDKNQNIVFNSSLNLKAFLMVDSSVNNYFISYAFIDPETKIVANLFSLIDNVSFTKTGKVEVVSTIPNINLGAGKFTLTISINEVLDDGTRGEVYYHNTNIGIINIIDVITAIAPVQFTGKWSETTLR